MNDLPPQYPTHEHAPEFWEVLGRTVATYGFLEEVLGKAIFAFTGTREYDDDEINTAYEAWLQNLENALSDPLGAQINSYEKAVSENPAAKIENFDKLVEDLRKAAVLRNVLCHGSWRTPDDSGKSIPFFVNRETQEFIEPIDVPRLKQTQEYVAGLTCAVINSVTHMGWQFPSSNSPGRCLF